MFEKEKIVMACVDVIMAAYNDEKRICAAIESILAQTFEDWRFIICDDGSKDNTYYVISRYAEKYPQKILVMRNEENKGLTFTLNRLIKETTAKYIARMDSDDRSKPKRLEQQVYFLDYHSEYAMVGTNVEKFDENGVFSVSRYPEKPDKKSFLWNSPFAHPSIMIRQEVLNILNGYNDKPRTYRCEDYDLWMRMYEKGYKGFNIQEPLLEYYEGKDSFRKRKFKYRITEMKTRWIGFLRLGLFPIGLLFMLKPLIVGLLPRGLLLEVKNRQKR